MTREEYNEYHRPIVRQSQKRRRAEAARKGLCSICCKERPEIGYKTCRSCREAVSKANKKRYAILTRKGDLMA